jgi:hypothetical protein
VTKLNPWRGSFQRNLAGRKWLDPIPVSDHGRALIFGINAKKLLTL